MGVEPIFERIIGLVQPSALVAGIGNIGGQGIDLVRYFANRGRAAAPQALPGPQPGPSAAAAADVPTVHSWGEKGGA
jgi:hypothetical protein